MSNMPSPAATPGTTGRRSSTTVSTTQKPCIQKKCVNKYNTEYLFENGWYAIPGENIYLCYVCVYTFINLLAPIIEQLMTV